MDGDVKHRHGKARPRDGNATLRNCLATPRRVKVTQCDAMATPSKADAESFAKARARKESALASIREMELAEHQGRLVDTAELLVRLQPILSGVKTAIEGSALPDADKRRLLQMIADEWPLKAATKNAQAPPRRAR